MTPGVGFDIPAFAPVFVHATAKPVGMETPYSLPSRCLLIHAAIEAGVYSPVVASHSGSAFAAAVVASRAACTAIPACSVAVVAEPEASEAEPAAAAAESEAAVALEPAFDADPAAAEADVAAEVADPSA